MERLRDLLHRSGTAQVEYSHKVIHSAPQPWSALNDTYNSGCLNTRRSSSSTFVHDSDIHAETSCTENELFTHADYADHHDHQHSHHVPSISNFSADTQDSPHNVLDSPKSQNHHTLVFHNTNVPPHKRSASIFRRISTLCSAVTSLSHRASDLKDSTKRALHQKIKHVTQRKVRAGGDERGWLLNVQRDKSSLWRGSPKERQTPGKKYIVSAEGVIVQDEIGRHVRLTGTRQATSIMD